MTDLKEKLRALGCPHACKPPCPHTHRFDEKVWPLIATALAEAGTARTVVTLPPQPKSDDYQPMGEFQTAMSAWERVCTAVVRGNRLEGV